MNRNPKNKFLIKLMLIIIIILVLFIIIHFATFNHHKVKEVTKIKYKEVVSENIVFLGDSITHRYDLDKFYPNYHVVNSGVSGNKTSDILNDMYNRVYKYNPSKVFILIGINQLENDSEIDIFNSIIDIVNKIHKNRPLAKIYVESIYPVNKKVSDIPRKKDNNKIKKINKFIKENAIKYKYVYINMYSELIDEEGNLKKEYTYDGLHISKEGFKIITKKLEKYIKD